MRVSVFDTLASRFLASKACAPEGGSRVIGSGTAKYIVHCTICHGLSYQEIGVWKRRGHRDPLGADTDLGRIFLHFFLCVMPARVAFGLSLEPYGKRFETRDEN